MAIDNLPPQDIDAESSCLASILLSKDALIKISGILEADDFYLDKHRIIYEAILELDRKNSPIDLLTLKQKLFIVISICCLGPTSVLQFLNFFNDI